MSYYYYQQNYLENPSYQHYDYISPGARCCSFGETAFYTLISPLYQSIQEKPGVLDDLLNTYYGADYICDEMEKVDKGERMEEGIGDNADFIGYLLLNLQRTCKKLKVISNLTCATLYELEITPEIQIKRLEELLPSGSSNYTIWAVRPGSEAPRPVKPTSVDRGQGKFDGYFSCSEKQPGVTYMMDGVRKHKPPRDSFWSRLKIAAMKTGWIVDAATGNTIDEFYGTCNDFNDWFLGYAGRGMKFFFYIDTHDGAAAVKRDTVSAFINRERLDFACNQQGEWSIAG